MQQTERANCEEPDRANRAEKSRYIGRSARLDREQAEQFTEEYIDDIYGPDEIVGYEITSIKEVENN